MPGRSLVIVPVPLPPSTALTAYFGSAVKVAVTVFAAVMLTVQVLPLMLVQPFQTMKLECNAGVAVRVTVSGVV